MVAVVVVVIESVVVLVTAVGNGFEEGWLNGVGDLVLLGNRCWW